MRILSFSGLIWVQELHEGGTTIKKLSYVICCVNKIREWLSNQFIVIVLDYVKRIK